jgi:hypothetical protein
MDWDPEFKALKFHSISILPCQLNTHSINGQEFQLHSCQQKLDESESATLEVYCQ